jgi:hydrogenase maturation protease
MNITIIGVGQSLRGDDAAGLTAVQLWQDAHPVTAQQVRVEIVENPGVSLLNLLEGSDAAILVDAVQSGSLPGTLHCLTEKELGAFLDGTDSAHGWGIAETLALGRTIDPENMPGQIMIIGIEIGQIKMGERLSPKVAAVLPETVQLIQGRIRNLLGKEGR